jgi:type II secretory pathway component PulF
MSIFNKVSEQEKVEFANNLSVMLKSGMTINEALFTLSEQTESKKFKEVLTNVRLQVQSGIPLSVAFETEKKTFGSIFISLLRVGESSGTLDDSLSYLADWLEHDNTLRKEIIAATTYPKFVFGATLTMGAGLALYILPKLIPLFSQLRVALPLPTRVLLATVAFVQNYWYVVIIGLVLIYFAFKGINKIRSVRKFLHIVYLKMPVAGGIITSYQLALVTRLFETLLKSGLPLRDSIEITSQAVTNLNYEDSLRAMNEKVKGGIPLSQAMVDYPELYPKNLISIIATGEKSGTMDTSLRYLADFYIKEVQLKTKQLPTILEPLLLVFIGIVVGFIAIAIIMPIYSLTSGVLK